MRGNTSITILYVHIFDPLLITALQFCGILRFRLIYSYLILVSKIRFVIKENISWPTSSFSKINTHAITSQHIRKDFKRDCIAKFTFPKHYHTFKKKPDTHY